MGFEPMVGYKPTLDFESSALNQLSHPSFAPRSGSYGGLSPPRGQKLFTRYHLTSKIFNCVAFYPFYTIE